MFEVKSQKYMPFFQRVSLRYAIPGRIDPDDLVQECLIVLHDLLQSYEGLPEDDFDRLVHKSTVNHVIDQSHKFHTSPCRDHRVELSSDSAGDNGGYASCGRRGSGASPATNRERVQWPDRGIIGPEDQAIYNEYVTRIRRALPEKGRKVLDLFISQDTESVRRELDDFNSAPPDGYVYNVKCEERLTTTFVAKYFDWSPRVARKYMKMVRERTTTVMAEVA